MNKREFIAAAIATCISIAAWEAMTTWYDPFTSSEDTTPPVNWHAKSVAIEDPAPPNQADHEKAVMRSAFGQETTPDGAYVVDITEQKVESAGRTYDVVTLVWLGYPVEQ